jgi:TPR repeat protein
VIVTFPGVTAVTSPPEDTVATPELEDCHVAVAVTFCVVPSEKCTRGSGPRPFARRPPSNRGTILERQVQAAASNYGIIWTESDLPKVFISYRREDTPGHAGRLYDRLKQEFGADNVFIDVDTLLPGDDFVDLIGETLGQCNLMIALIGPRWLTAADDHGRLRLDDQRDFVRIEILTALERRIRTVPVLVDRALMPQEQELPEALRLLARRQAIELSDTRWASDVGVLVEKIKRAVASPSAGERPPVSSTPTPVPSEIPAASAVPAAPPNNPVHGEPARPALRGNWGVWSGVSVLVAGLIVVALLLMGPSREQVVGPGGDQNGSHTTVPVASAVPGGRPDAPGKPPAREAPAGMGRSDPATGERSARGQGQQAGQRLELPVKPCRDDDKDARRCIQACDEGDAGSCTNLGLMYAAGRAGLTKDEARAAALYQRACDGGNKRGCTNLGRMYETGRGGLPTDEVRALALLKGACEAGDAPGCTGLGRMYETGRGGLPKDEARAVALYQSACGAGAAVGCNDLGVMYLNGRGGLTKDETRAATLYERACSAGNAVACSNLGVMYVNGRGGLPKDEVRAVGLYQRGCDTGEAPGCVNLGRMYETGRGGLRKDEARATTLYQRACDGGNLIACRNLQRLKRER